MTNLADKLEVAAAAKADGVDTTEALTIFEMVARQQEAVDKALPSGMHADRFVRMVLTEIRRTPKLAQCDPATLLGAMMLSAQTGLEPGGPLGQAFLIPRWSNKRKVLEAQFQIGYKGYVQLAGRAGISVRAKTVRIGDEFDYQYGTDQWVWHKPVIGSTTDSIAWYATGHFANGLPPAFEVIDRNVTERARAAGKAGDYGPWTTDYDPMAEKTALLRLTRWLPLSTEIATVIAADGAVVSGVTSIEDAAQAAVDAAADPELESGASDDAPEGQRP